MKFTRGNVKIGTCGVAGRYCEKNISFIRSVDRKMRHLIGGIKVWRRSIVMQHLMFGKQTLFFKRRLQYKHVCEAHYIR